jgi:predicted SAM-dependent methyltransferase
VVSEVAGVKNSIPYIVFRRYNKALRRAVKLPRYLGSQHRCPVCHIGLRAFKPIWKSYSRNVERYGYIHRHTEQETFNVDAFSCPRCDASDRERLIALFLDGIWPSLRRGGTVRLIDFAPAYPLSRKVKRYPGIEYRSADLFRNDVQDRIDLTAISYPDQSVDVFICSHILEHVPDDRKAMRELHRILKPGGFGLVLVPLVVGVEETHEDPAIQSGELRWKYFGMDDHVRHYGRRDLIERLSGAGFTVDQLGIDHFGRETFRRAGIAENSVLYVARRDESPAGLAPATQKAKALPVPEPIGCSPPITPRR